jgi:hypothetical protein
MLRSTRRGLETWQGRNASTPAGAPVLDPTEYKETAAAVLAWAKENGIVLADDREKLPAASPLHRKAALDRQDRERSAALRREAAVSPSPVAPLARPVPASPPQQPKPATSTLLPKL